MKLLSYQEAKNYLGINQGMFNSLIESFDIEKIFTGNNSFAMSVKIRPRFKLKDIQTLKRYIKQKGLDKPIKPIGEDY